MKELRIGMIGYGFMGKTHSNAYVQAANFFKSNHRPVLKALCARNIEKAKPFADNWGYESVETDWRKLMQWIFALPTICTKRSPSLLPKLAR
jgi:predicted dehydrogenase